MSILYGAAAASARGHGMTSQRARDRLVATLRAEGIADPRVLDVIRTTPRHLFIDEALASRAYENTALPIGLGQTISQPWVVARMTELLIEHGVPQRVLEVGTGSGYQAAVLAQLVGTVYTVERIEELLRKTRRLFRTMKIENIRTRHDDGNIGWPAEAPFDAIVLTAAGESVPRALCEQLVDGGLLVAPLGPSGSQRLTRFRRDGDAWPREEFEAVSFVPLLGGLG
ncbi:MAG TPA: protein-L-isoaspartate(D-aspartate) O-methyltransferase [Rhodanobacteraceae bacterium]|jgi:protein-L-isoaspartate(D-aspartate) O-methyltransferase|nr:protein-L-isoaspartate(D-aspartate) O-methyltransferase [Rhodanobacteraceae bacterium]